MATDPKATELAVERLKQTDARDGNWIFISKTSTGSTAVIATGTYRETIDQLNKALNTVHKTWALRQRKSNKTRTGRFSSRSKEQNIEYRCPHGYTESNDCPDCCH